MEFSHQKELLLCALKHFDIEVVNAGEHQVVIEKSTRIAMAEGSQFQLWRAGRQEATFKDVVKLCTYIKTHQEWNEKSGVENSGAG